MNCRLQVSPCFLLLSFVFISRQHFPIFPCFPSFFFIDIRVRVVVTHTQPEKKNNFKPGNAFAIVGIVLDPVFASFSVFLLFAFISRQHFPFFTSFFFRRYTCPGHYTARKKKTTLNQAKHLPSLA